MTNLIIRAFVPNHTETSNPAVRQRYGLVAGAVGICSNLILFLGKILVGLLFSSVSIVADAVNNLSDAGSSIITLLGFKISSKPADKDHPFGHARVEYICGLAVSFIILFLGLELLKTSISKIIHPEPMAFSILTVAVLTASILIKLWQGLFNRKVGNLIDSSSLRATAADSINDVVSTSAVLAALLASRFFGWNLDGYAGVAVALFILWSGVNLAKEAMDLILGTSSNPEQTRFLTEKVLSYPGIVGVHDIMIHDYGPGHAFASLHAEVPASTDIMESHDLIDNIERDVYREAGIRLVIHMDPVDTDNPEIERLRQLADGVIKGIAPDLTLHDFRVVFGTTHHNLVFDVVCPHGFSLRPQQLQEKIQEELTKIDPMLLSVVTVDTPF